MVTQEHIDAIWAALARLEDRLAALEARQNGRADAEWEESKHPRAEDGKFGSGSGSAKAAPSPSAKASEKSGVAAPKAAAHKPAMEAYPGLTPTGKEMAEDYAASMKRQGVSPGDLEKDITEIEALRDDFSERGHDDLAAKEAYRADLLRQLLPKKAKADPGKSGGDQGAAPKRAPLFDHKAMASLPKSSAIRQPHNSWEALNHHGVEGREQFVKMLDALGLPPERLSIPPNKSEGRSREKVETDYDGDWTQIKDVVRGTIISNNLGEMEQAVADLQKAGIELAAQPKDKVSNPTPEGYRDINVLVKLPNGMVAELQFNVPRMLEAKEEMHNVYARQQKIQRKNGSAEPNSTWSEQDTDTFLALREEQLAVYSAAWEEVEAAG